MERLSVCVVGSDHPEEHGRVLTARSQVKGHPHMRFVEPVFFAPSFFKAEDPVRVLPSDFDVLWVLSPTYITRHSVTMWFRCGYVLGHNPRPVLVFVSGPSVLENTPFNMFEDDKTAFMALCDRADEFFTGVAR